jgi:hypothetical protein
LIYLHSKNGKSWLPWRRPGDKRNELQFLDCPKAKQLSAIALTRSARWNQISALGREQLYRRNSKIQLAAWWSDGVTARRVDGVTALGVVGVCCPEGVQELSPGWRLCGTLGKGFFMRFAL